MFKFKLIGGDHVDEKKCTYHRGDVITTKLDLRKAFGDKFLLLADDPQEVEKSKEVDVTPVKATSEAAMKFGKDVTKAMFPTAFDNGFRVFQRVKAFYVMDEDDLDTPLNEKKLSQDSVEKFIEKRI